VIVGLGLLAAQLILNGVGRGPSWDEAVYLAQADAGGPTIPFAPSRARGIVWLVVPLVRLGLPLWGIRLALAVASSAAIAAAAAAWAPTIGRWRAAAAAALFGGSWLALFYGPEVMPNLWGAIALLAAGGFVALGLARRMGRPPWPALLLIVAASLVRPFDAALATVGLVAAVLWAATRGRVVWVAGLVVALALGWLPWLVEMSQRTGGPFDALEAAAGVGHVGGAGSIGTRLIQHLSLSDGPLIGPERPAAVSGGAVLWWAVALVLAVLAASHRRRPARTAGRVALLAGLVLTVGYVGLVTGLAPRFLLPAIAFLSVGIVLGVTTIPRRAAVVVWAGMLVWLGWQVAIVVPAARTAAAERAAVVRAAEALERVAGGAPCRAIATDAAPQLAYTSGCEVAWVRPAEAPPQPPDAPGTLVLVREGDLPAWQAALGTPVETVPGWRIYRR
jgi:hypothetical protein